MTETYSHLGTVLFVLAVLHTFSIKRFQHLANKYPEGSVGENLFHLLGEVEVVFGLWAGALVFSLLVMTSQHDLVFFLNSLNFTEPGFVFVIMVMASTQPVIQLATLLVERAGQLIPLSKPIRFYTAALIVGPLLGGLITEPAAMTVTALLLKDRFFDRGLSERFKYMTLAVLFVNISIGGVTTHFAAPPVLMVASLWNWDTPYMFDHFGWKAIIAVVVNTLVAASLLKKELKTVSKDTTKPERTPAWIYLFHIAFLASVVASSHHMVLFMGIFLFFLGFVTITKEYQSELKLKESLLVSFFLGGLVVLGAFQSWWLKPILESLPAFPLFTGATVLTGFVDNAALTYLGAQVEGITEEMKYALLAGAVAGGGLTVIANAPNPAGFSILQRSFGKEGVSPLRLFLYALPPTLVAMSALWLL